MKSGQKQQLNHNLSKPSAIAKYGTAGYRLNTPDLNNVICRASLIAYVRSATFAGKYIGLYITASHNPSDYNGVKFVDYNGNMLDEAWENASDELVNSENGDFHTIINKLFRQNSNYSGMSDAIYGNVIVGRDTRDSGVSLTENIKDVLKGYRCKVYDYGLVTCPEMHFLIRRCNEANEMVDKSCYLKHVLGCYGRLSSITGLDAPMGIDTANGMAGVKMEEILETNPEFKVEVLNENGILNKDCGADFVKVKKSLPKIRKSRHHLCASFDGDVDRLVLYTTSGTIFDGDAQCVFIADFIKGLVEKYKIDCSVGVVLSYYSNMGATDYLKKAFPVVLAQTGVKNFVKEAKKFDVGIYFEPNGHGSVVYSKKFLDAVDGIPDKSNALKIVSEIFDPCVGDALANFLFFKASVSQLEDLCKFKENPSRLLTVRIKDKHRIKVDSRNIVLEPDIQKDIDQQALTFKGRGFVRPSGTEDLVRVYAEAPTEAACDRLALTIAQIVYDSCEGIGNYPEIDYSAKEK